MDSVIACHGCDLMVDLAGLPEGQRAYCPCCGHRLSRRQKSAPEHIAAYAMAALITLLIACAFPFLSFAAAGLESVMTLPETAQALWDNGLPLVGLLVAAFIVLIPSVLLALLLALTLPLSRGQWRPWLKPLARWVFRLTSWSMVEVFIIGVIVSLVKIAKMATVTLGLAFWAYVAFAILFTLALALLDRYQLWQRIDALEQSQLAH
ncbi:MAG: paraquat-inducible protein A [Pseudomonadota bacterium]